jgi:hypothetical protein
LDRPASTRVLDEPRTTNSRGDQCTSVPHP